MYDNADETQDESLDPQDWDALRDLGHRMVDDMLDYLATVRERPIWRPVPAEVRTALSGPVPRDPEGIDRAYADFKEFVLPYPFGNIHPRHWGWVNGTGSPSGALMEMLAATMNPNVAGFDQSARLVEEQVLDWMRSLMGFPEGAGGLLVSGASMANLIGLAVARNTRAGFDIRREGVAAAPGMLTVYCSTETHTSVHKAVELLGLGRAALREIPVDGQYRIDLDILKETIADDRRQGRRPIAVVGTAGTVNTGAIDPLEPLAELCRAEDLWFHVDGAFGALLTLSADLGPLVAGLERADSLAFDLHKWIYLPYEAGCILIRDGQHQQDSFTVPAAYLTPLTGGVAAAPWLADYGLQLSRQFRALKVWMSLKEHGVDKFARLIEQNVAQAQYLADKIEATPMLELLAPVPLNIVCFRYNPGHLEADALNLLNRDILVQVQERGIAVPSSTELQGRFALRVAHTNHRSRREDFDLLVDAVLKIGAELANRENNSKEPM